MRKLKIAIDISMLVFLTLSLFNWSINIIFHITTASIFATLIAVHVVLNIKWNEGRNKSDSKRKSKRRS